MAQVYKIKISQNIIRQVILTDVNILLLFDFILILSIWYFGSSLNLQIKVFSSFTILIFSFVLFSIKIDRQPLFTIFCRAVLHFYRTKQNIF